MTEPTPDTYARALACVGLVREHLPTDAEDDGRSAKWPLVGLALIARAAGTVESLEELQPEGRVFDSATLVRTLYEHVVHLAWLAADSSPARLEEWQKDDLRQTLVADGETQARGFAILEPDQRTELQERFDEMKGNPLNLADLAVAADKHWGGKLTGIVHQSEALSFRGLYAIIYRYTSTRAHPSYRGINPVVTRLSPSRSRVHMEQDVPTSAFNALGTGSVLLGLGLFVCDASLGWHVRDRVLEIFRQYPT
jgi:hypothetical protein